MDQTYLTVKENGTHEIEIKKSRFIATVARISSEDEAKEIIQAVRKEHWKATHNCVAYTLGNHQEIQRSQDDGEPSGTAGVPILEVLKQRELINTLVVVTRYFGGTKLGAGGLIRAYSSAVSEAIDAIGMVKGVLQQALFVTVDYASHGKLEHFLSLHPEYYLADTQFTDTVTLQLMIDEPDVEQAIEDLNNLLNGTATFKKGETSYVELPYTLPK
ncbi:YigZ family protein [Vagococcus lutrae]|uniref:YigZ family protein n=1 Tax=Vagococcus lutrae TaxID=81947 RepID=UPI0028923552|nr:YigZ family protein [Vagococcus lutrae]MDT2826749.1 YigZ family protein [Vagococcus lutrae]